MMALDSMRGRLDCEVRVLDHDHWAISGELDLDSRAALIEACRMRAGGGSLTIDLEQLTFLDVAGWRGLDHVRRRTRPARLEVVNAAGRVASVLEFMASGGRAA